MNKKFTSLIILLLFIGIIFIPSYDASTKYENRVLYNEQQQATNEIFFDKYIEILMRFAHKPSVSACIIKDETVVWRKGYGLYNIEKNKPAQPDTLYLSASISKTVTATALMQLYEQDLFDLDEDVNNYLPFSLRNPNYPDSPITFRMLLSHRSSLAGDNEYWICLSYVPGDPDIPDYPHPWLKDYLTPNGSAYSPIVWSDKPPGEIYAYANIGFAIIGYLVELISGEKFDQYCKEHIFEPLEMYNTSFRLKDVNISNMAVPYEYKKRDYIPHPHYNMYVMYPAGSMRTSVEELSHFLIANMNAGMWNNIRILNSTTVQLMHKDHYSSKNNEKYGLGWMLGKNFLRKKEIGHSGGWPGVHTLMKYRPEDNTAVIVFTNQMSPTYNVKRSEFLAFNIMFNSFFLKANML
jgi:CubicO group peptidase (beta-lactamase class C family)